MSQTDSLHSLLTLLCGTLHVCVRQRGHIWHRCASTAGKQTLQCLIFFIYLLCEKVTKFERLVALNIKVCKNMCIFKHTEQYMNISAAPCLCRYSLTAAQTLMNRFTKMIYWCFIITVSAAFIFGCSCLRHCGLLHDSDWIIVINQYFDTSASNSL